MRPVVGISCYVEAVDRDPWRAQRSAVLPWMYAEHVERAGGIAVVLPPRGELTSAAAVAAEVLDRVDALVIAGGADVEASRYGAAPHATSQSPRPDRDEWELALVHEAVRRDLPLLGVCRGMQVMAVAAGGTLTQHLPDVVKHEGHLPAAGVWTRHPVTPVAGTRLAAILGTDPLDVPTYHHQGVASWAAYTPSAWHSDGTIEAFEDPAARFRVAVQWHPEAGEDGRLFAALVTSASGPAADE